MSRSKFLGLSSVPLIALAATVPAAAQTPGSGELPQATPAQGGRTTVYEVAFFAQYAPRTALDIVQRIPGFTLDLGANEAATGVDVRGFAGTAGNVVINGARPSSKSETLQAVLARIPASRVKSVQVGAGELYGADYSGKSQVANLILSAEKGIAGNLTASAVRHWHGSIIPNASGSVVFSRGPSSFNLSADLGRTDYYEEGFDRLTDPVTGELIEYRRKYNSIHPHDPYVAGSWALENGDNKSIHVNARFAPSRFFLRQKNHVVPTDGDERDDNLVENYKTRVFELGGDVTRPFAGGAIKILGLANRRHRTTLDEYHIRNLDSTEILGGFQQLTESQRDETIGRLTWSRQDLAGFRVEIGGEAALNTLDYHLDLFDLEEGGGKVRENLPIQDATVKENRAEVWVNAGRALSNVLRVDAGLNFEFSKLKVRGDALADRKLKFLKPSLTLDWQPGGGWHTQLIIRRVVAQLDFYDFVSSADLAAGRVNGGNADLQPQRSWEGRFLIEHPIFGQGKVRLELGYDLVSMLQDRILIFDDEGNGFDAPGNLGTGRRQYADLTFDAPLDRLWKGLRVKLHGQVQRTRVEDPIGHFMRDWSGFYPRWQWDVDIRRDAGKFAYGFQINDYRRTTFFRTDEFDSNFNEGFPYTNAFIEYRPSANRTLTLNLEDLSNTAGARHRILFDPNRTANAPSFDEFRFRNSHVRVGITFKQSIGGSSAVSPSS
jgi:TonB-dependent Receptor Plug Domain